MNDSYELEKDKQLPSVVSISTFEKIKIPEEYRYGSCK